MTKPRKLEDLFNNVDVPISPSKRQRVQKVCNASSLSETQSVGKPKTVTTTTLSDAFGKFCLYPTNIRQRKKSRLYTNSDSTKDAGLLNKAKEAVSRKRTMIETFIKQKKKGKASSQAQDQNNSPSSPNRPTDEHLQFMLSNSSLRRPSNKPSRDVLLARNTHVRDVLTPKTIKAKKSILPPNAIAGSMIFSEIDKENVGHRSSGAKHRYLSSNIFTERADTQNSDRQQPPLQLADTVSASMLFQRMEEDI